MAHPPPLLKALTKAVLLLALASGSAAPGVAPQHDFRGIPYFRFFGAEDFDSSAAASFVTTSSDGAVFYCDRNWLFLFDGITWRKIYQNSNTDNKITALHWDPDGRIYAGGYNMIGEILLDETNKAAFRHLVDPKTIAVPEHFDRITSTDTTLYLQGRRSIAIYDKASREVDAHVFETWLTASFTLDGDFHIVTDANEVLRYADESFTTLPALTETISKQDITIADTAVAPNGDIIMGSERRGLFRFDGDSLVTAYANYKHDPDHLLRDIELTSDNRLILATLGGGIFVLDEEGTELERFGGNVDHRFKSTRGVTIDRSGAIWSMSNSTVAKILIDSSLSAIDERIRPSFFYATQHMQDGDLFVRSFYILYRALYDENNRITAFENALPNANFEVWAIAEGSDGLYVNTADQGMFRLAGGQLTHLADSEAFDRLNQSSRFPDLIIGANASNITLFEKRGDSLAIIDTIQNPGQFINRMEEDGNGDFWLEYGLGAAGRIRIEDRRIDITYFSREHGLPPQEWLTIWMHHGQGYYTDSYGVLQLDPETGSFVRSDLIEDIMPGAGLRIERAFTDPAGNIWISANDTNMIFWLREDGSYRVDDTSLAEMGEPYFEFLTHFGNGEALIMTALEFFHYRQTENTLAQIDGQLDTRIIGISNSSGDERHFTYLGDGSVPSPRTYPYSENSLVFNVANSFSYTTQSPAFQYFLEGFSSGALPTEQSPWIHSSVANFTNLNAGDYTFKARARLGSGEISSWTKYPFAIARPFYQSYLAYFLYFILLMLLVLLAIDLYSRRLKAQNLRLERMVTQRTTEIEAKNVELETQADILESQNQELASQSEEIQRKAAELAGALSQLRETQDQLLATARTAGRAEVATNVLHNVGNVLNSVNVGIAKLDRLLARSRVDGLRKLSYLLKSHRDDLSSFLSSDAKGKRIPEYLEQLSATLGAELDSFAAEVKRIEDNVEHIKKIISTQQSHAKNIGMLQFIDLTELLDSALAIILGDSFHSSFEVTRRYEPDLVVHTDKHKVLEVLINLIKNASESILESGVALRHLELVGKHDSGTNTVQVAITDNGVGIDGQNLDKLFTHGFTTKSAGHGFGLHSCANAIKSLGGRLRIDSPGPGKGATATVILPRR